MNINDSFTALRIQGDKQGVPEETSSSLSMKVSDHSKNASWISQHKYPVVGNSENNAQDHQIR